MGCGKKAVLFDCDDEGRNTTWCLQKLQGKIEDEEVLIFDLEHMKRTFSCES